MIFYPSPCRQQNNNKMVVNLPLAWLAPPSINYMDILRMRTGVFNKPEDMVEALDDEVRTIDEV